MADEAATQMGAAPTHVFIQGGVGGVAAAVSAQMRARFGGSVRVIVAEPDKAACLLASAEAGHAVTTRLLLPEAELTRVTILPSSRGAAGYSLSAQPEKTLYTRAERSPKRWAYIAASMANYWRKFNAFPPPRD